MSMIALIITVKRWKQYKCPSVDWIGTMCSTHLGEYDSHAEERGPATCHHTDVPGALCSVKGRPKGPHIV